MRQFRIVSAIVAGLVLPLLLTITTDAYDSYGKWSTGPILIYANPVSPDLSSTAIETALQTAMQVWNSAGVPTQLQYAGRTNDTTAAYNGRSAVMFRDSSSGSTIASTYAWSTNGYLVEADTIFWDAGRQFFTGTSGCFDGAYVEDIATHEFGHSLGLGHSSDPEATMYPMYYTCSTSLRTLASDDLLGLGSLYNLLTSVLNPPKVINTAPTVTMTSPLNGAAYGANPSVWFDGSANDSQDGDLTPGIAWTSSVDGYLGTGVRFSRTLSAGYHVITATVTDTGGLSASTQISLTVAADTPPPTTSDAISVTVDGYKVRRLQKANVWWAGFNSASVNIYRDGALITTTENDGFYTDPINVRGSGSYTYQVCGGDPYVCSDSVTITF